MKHIILPFIALMSTLGAATLYFYNTPGSPHIPVKPAVLWKHYYDQKNDAALTVVAQAFHIPDAVIQEIKDTVIRLKAQDPVFNSTAQHGKITVSNPDHPLTHLVLQCLTERGMQANVVSIIIDEDMAGAASSLQKYSPRTDRVKTTIKINPLELGQRSFEQQEAIVLHETSHIDQYDAIEEGYLLAHLFKQGHSEEEIDENPAMIQYRHFKEFRADQLAALHGGARIAQAFKNDLSTTEWNEETLSHPSSEQRIAQMDTVLHHIENNTVATA